MSPYRALDIAARVRVLERRKQELDVTIQELEKRLSDSMARYEQRSAAALQTSAAWGIFRNSFLLALAAYIGIYALSRL